MYLTCIQLCWHGELVQGFCPVGTNTPCGKKRSICADDICTGTICRAEKGGVTGSRNTFFSLERFANVLELAVALWCKWYLRGRVEDFRGTTKNMQIWRK